MGNYLLTKDCVNFCLHIVTKIFNLSYSYKLLLEIPDFPCSFSENIRKNDIKNMLGPLRSLAQGVRGLAAKLMS